MTPIVQVEHLSKYFKTPKGLLHAVEDVSFSMEPMTTLGVVGESGCGKSTLGRVIMGLHDASDGKLFFEGEDVTHPTRARAKQLRRDLQMIFQDPYSSLDPRMCVSDLIAEPMKSMRLFGKREREQRVAELMDTVGLARRFAFSYPHELDGGRRQRIGVAKALALEPEFIVCDEPVSALDVSIQAQILNLLQDLQRDKHLTYMFITHDLSVVRHISNTICVMYLGQVIEQCGTDELFEHTLHPYSQALLSAIPVPSVDDRPQRILLTGEVSSPINPENTCRFAPRCRFCTEECRSRPAPGLRDMGNGHLVACHRVEEIN